MIGETSKTTEASSGKLYRVSFQKFYRGVPTDEKSRVDVRNQSVETAEISLHQLAPIMGSDKELISMQLALRSIRDFAKKNGVPQRIDDANLRLVFHTAVRTITEGKRELCQAPFWVSDQIPIEVDALNGEVSENE